MAQARQPGQKGLAMVKAVVTRIKARHLERVSDRARAVRKAAVNKVVRVVQNSNPLSAEQKVGIKLMGMLFLGTQMNCSRQFLGKSRIWTC